MPRSAQARKLSLPRLMLYIALSPLIVVGTFMLAMLGFGALAAVASLLAAAVGR